MRRLALLAGIVSLVASCGGSDQAPVVTDDPPASAAAAPPPPTEVETAPEQPIKARPLSAAERRRVTTIASRVERAVERFDRTATACSGPDGDSCIDRAWAVIATDAEWPLYYLVRMRPRARGCDTLAEAMAELDGFNLAGRQVDYGPPDGTGQSKSRARIALVDTLRPLPDELRIAAATSCG